MTAGPGGTEALTRLANLGGPPTGRCHGAPIGEPTTMERDNGNEALAERAGAPCVAGRHRLRRLAGHRRLPDRAGPGRPGPPVDRLEGYATVASKSLCSVGFWIGPRPPLIPLLIKAFGTSTGFVTAQAVIAALAWGLLAWTVGRLVSPGWRRLVATWTILAFATALPITLWNRSVLSESLSLSTLALVFAGFIWTARRSTWPRLVATALACLGFAAARDAQVWTVAFLRWRSGSSPSSGWRRAGPAPPGGPVSWPSACWSWPR